MAALTLLGLAANATMIVLPLYIVHGLNGTHLDVSVMLGLGALMEIPMMLALGAKSSTLHKPNWLAACAAVHAVYFVGMSLAGSVHVLIPMQMLNAFVVAVTSCLGMTYVQDLMPHAPGRATALFFNAARVGSILSGVLSGLLVQAFSYRGTFLFCGLLALVRAGAVRRAGLSLSADVARGEAVCRASSTRRLRQGAVSASAACASEAVTGCKQRATLAIAAITPLRQTAYVS